MAYTGKSYLDLPGLTRYDGLIKEYVTRKVNTLSNLTGAGEPTANQGVEGSMYFQTEIDGETVKIKKTYVKSNNTWIELKMGGSGVISSTLTTSVTVEREG